MKSALGTGNVWPEIQEALSGAKDQSPPAAQSSRRQSESREVQKAPCLLCNEVQDVCCHNTQRSIRALSDVITSAIFIEDNHPVSSAHYMGTEKVTGPRLAGAVC
ncbi:hypothetical protein JOQ06_017098, partial [Pogonophryne albipinna]